MDAKAWKRAVAALALGGAVLALGGVAANTVAAQQAPAGPPTAQTQPGAGPRERHEQFLAALAAKLNVSTDQLKQAMEQTRQELGLPTGRGGPGGGPGHGGLRMGFETAARAIGISPDQLRQELPNKSLADVAKAHGVDPTTVANTLKAEATAHVDQALSAGRITADQATQMKQRMNDQIDQLMNRQLPADLPQRNSQPGQGRAPAGGEAFARGGARL